MKKINKTDVIDIEEEISAIFDFTKNRWHGIDTEELKQILDFSFKQGLDAGKYWLESYACQDICLSWTDDRKNEKNWNFSENKDFYLDRVTTYDDIYKIGDWLRSGSRPLREAVLDGWDYDREVNSVVKKVLEVTPNAKKIRPNGWEELRKNYSDFDGFDEYNDNQHEIDFEEFKGVNSSGAGACGFHERISLPSTMYDDSCQGRNPLRVLMGAAFSHALFVMMHNNEVEITNEINNLRNFYFVPENFKKITYLDDITQITNHKLTKALLISAFEADKQFSSKYDKGYHDQDSLDVHLKNMMIENQEFMKIPQEERDAQRKERMAEIMASLSSTLKPNAEELELENLEDLRIKNVISSFLNDNNKNKKRI